MVFCVVQTRKTKKSKPVLSIVPSKWVQDGYVSWPPNNFISLSTDANSVPNPSWIKQLCKVVGRGKTYREGEDVVSRLEEITDSEDAVQQQVTRGRPPKKKVKFEAKTYTLTPPQKQPILTAGNLHHNDSFVEPTPNIVNSEDPLPDFEEISPPVPNEDLQLDYTEPLALDSSGIIPSIIQAPAATHLQSPEIPRLSSHEPDVALLAATPHVDHVQIVQPDQPVSRQSDAPNMFHPDIQSVNIVDGRNGKQYISLGYDCFEIVSGTSMDSAVIPNANQGCESTNDRTHVTEPEIILQESTTDSQMEEIRARLTRIEGILEQVLLFAANFNKLMEAKSTATAAGEKKREQEKFPDIEALFPVSSEIQLMVFEGNLKTKEYEDRCFRYFDSQYSLTGKREGAPFFKTLLRKVLVPTILSPFSWKGNNRNNAEVPNVPNRSFRSSFPYFVSFVQRVVCAADIAHTAEANDTCFSQFLRQKNIEIHRYLQGHQNQRATCSRKRKNVMETPNAEVLIDRPDISQSFEEQ